MDGIANTLRPMHRQHPSKTTFTIPGWVEPTVSFINVLTKCIMTLVFHLKQTLNSASNEAQCSSKESRKEALRTHRQSSGEGADLQEPLVASSAATMNRKVRTNYRVFSEDSSFLCCPCNFFGALLIPYETFRAFAKRLQSDVLTKVAIVIQVFSS